MGDHLFETLVPEKKQHATFPFLKHNLSVSLDVYDDKTKEHLWVLGFVEYAWVSASEDFLYIQIIDHRVVDLRDAKKAAFKNKDFERAALLNEQIENIVREYRRDK